MLYHVSFYNTFDVHVGTMEIEAPNDKTAIRIVDGMAELSDERRAELWICERVVKLYPFKSKLRSVQNPAGP